MEEKSQKEAKASESEDQTKEANLVGQENLKADLKAAQDEISKFRDEAEKLRKSNVSLEVEVGNISKERDSLKDELSQANEKHLKKVQDLESQIGTLTREKESAQGHLKKIQEESLTWKSSEESLKNKISELERNLNECNTTSLFKCLNHLVTSMSAKQQGSSRVTLDDLIKAEQELKKECISFESKTSIPKELKDEMKKLNELLEAKKVSSTVNKLLDDLEESTKKLSAVQLEKEQLASTTELDDLKKELEQIKLEKNSLTDTISSLTTANNKLSDDCNSLKVEKEGLQLNIASLEKELQKASESHNFELEKLREELVKFKEENQKQEFIITDLNKKIDEIAITHNEKNNKKIEMLNADLDKYKIQLDDLTNERDDLKNKLNVYEIQTEEKSKIHKLESQKLEDEIKDLRKEREVHLEQLSLLEKERDSLLEKSLTLEQRITELTENQEALKNLPVQTGINAGSTEQPAIQPIELSQEPKGEDQAQTLSSQDGDGNQTQEMDEDRLGVQSEDIDKEIKKIKSKISDLENKLSTEKGKKKDTIQKQINEQKSKLDELTKEEHRISVIAKEHQAVKVTGADGEPAPEESAAKLDQTIEADKQELTKIQQDLHDGHKLDHDLQAEITHLMMEKEKLTDNVALLANLIKTEIAEVEKAKKETGQQRELVSALREIERLVHGLETAEKEEYGKKVKEVVAVLHRVEQEEPKKQDDSTTVHSTDIPKVVIVPDQSDNHRPTEIPPEIQDLKSRLEESTKREQKLIDKVREIEDKFVKVNLYIEKVTEHIAQLDTEIKEKNHELLEVSLEAVEANRFVNSQEIIKSIVSRAIQGVKAINDKTSTNVEEEIKELIKIMEGIEQTMEENKKKHKADNQSLRDKILELEHQRVKVTGADRESAPEETAAKLDQTIEADKQELTKIQQELHDGHKLDHNLQEQITHLMMEKEKLTDNVALLANLIKTEIAEVEKAKKETGQQRELVSALREIERLVHGLETAEKEEYGKKVKEVVAILHNLENADEKDQSFSSPKEKNVSQSDLKNEKISAELNEQSKILENSVASRQNAGLDHQNNLEKLENVKKEIEKITGEIEILKNETEAKESELTKLRNELTSKIEHKKVQEESFSKVDQELREIRMKVTSLESNNRGKEKTASDEDNENQRLEDSLKKLEEESLNLDTRIKEAQEKKKSLQLTLENLRKDFKIKEDQFSKAAEEVLSSEKSLKMFNKKLSTFEEKLTLLDTKIELDESKLKSIDEDIVEKVVESLMTSIDNLYGVHSTTVRDFKEVEKKMNSDLDKPNMSELITKSITLEASAKARSAEIKELIAKTMSFIRGAKLDEHIAEIRQASVLVTSVRLQIEKAVELINLVHKEDSTSNLDKGEKNLDEMVKSMKDSVEVLNNFIQEWPNRNQKVQDPRETPNILGAFDTIRDLIYKIQDGSIMMVKLLMLYSDISRNSMSEDEKNKIHEFTRQIDQNIDQFERLINRSQSDIDLNILLDISKEFAARECRIQGGIEKIAEDCYSNLPSRRSLRGSPQKPEQSPSGMGYFIDRD